MPEPCAHSYPARAAADRGVGWPMHRFAPARLYGAIPSIDILQCRVPPSPPAIRDMKKPRLRIRRGFDFLYRSCGDALGCRFGGLYLFPDAEMARLGHQEEAEHEAHRGNQDRIEQGVAEAARRRERRRC